MKLNHTLLGFMSKLVFLIFCCFSLASIKAQVNMLNNKTNIIVDTGLITTIDGNLINSNDGTVKINGTLKLSGNFSNTANFDQDTGFVVLNGNRLQQINGDSSTFYFLELDNAAGAITASGVNRIRHTLTLSSGILLTNDSLILISDSSLTARIAEIQVGADINGDIVMERYLDQGVTGWHLLAAATSGGTLEEWDDDIVTSGFTGSDFPGFSFNNIHTYQESVAFVKDSGYYGATNINNIIQSDLGYYVYIGPVPLTLDTKGPAHKFTQVLPVTFTNNLNLTEDGWNLVANPYPSDINWNAAGWTKSNIDNAIYVYDADNGVYTSYVSGIATNGGSPYIASSQGFWVKANAVLPTLTLTETVKTNVASSYFRQKADLSKSPLIRLKVQAVNGSLSDETVLSFSNLGSTHWDGDYDAYKLADDYSSAPYIATVLHDTIDLSINALPNIVNGSGIPLRVKVKNSSQHKIEIGRNPTINPENCLYLEDLDNGKITDLKMDSLYVFNISDTVVHPRFMIHTNPVVDLGPDTFLTHASSFELDAGPGFATYLWSTGKTSRKIMVNDTGTYAVTVKNTLGCTGSDWIKIDLDPTTTDRTLIDHDISDFQFYPNPASSHFFIVVNGVKNRECALKILAYNGALIGYKEIIAIDGRIDLKVNTDNLSSGIYVVQLYSGGELLSNTKFVKE